MPSPHEALITVETPEHVVFEYELAGVGTRIVAALLDLLFVALAGFAMACFVGIVATMSKGWAIAILSLGIFFLMWCYPIVFEIWWKGQTPGKRIMKLRVIRDGGYALTPSVVIVRNLLRAADFLPLLYFTGFLVMMIGRRYKRIGDHVAGTLVIRDRPKVVVPERVETKRLLLADDEVVAELRRAGVHKLSPDQIWRIEELLRRRDELEFEARMRLIGELAHEMAQRLGVRVRGAYRFLQNIVFAYRENERAQLGGFAGEALFVKHNRPDWLKLENYAARLEGVGTRLSGQELFTFISLYRKVAGDLARAKTLRMRDDLVDYLNQLVGKVHFRVYAARPYRMGELAAFYLRIFPQTVRRLWRYVVASTLLLLVPAAAAYVAVRQNPALGSSFAPPGYIETIDKAFGESFGKENRSGEMGAFATAFYIRNNVQVSFLAFALGFFLGLGSVYILVSNGLILGGVAAVIRQYGLSYNFWSFVSSHGGIELGAIVLAGAAGMRVGLSFVNPGMLTRRAALVAGAKDAGLIMAGVATLLVIAAFLEAWVSPSTLPNPLKLGLGVVNLTAFLLYLIFAGRRQN